MEISRFDDATEFLRHAGPLLRGHAIDNNVMLGIAGRLADTPHADAVMFTVDEAGAPCLAGLMTPPWRLIVSTGAVEAVATLVDAIIDIGPRPPGVIGPGHMAEAFAATWHEATGGNMALADEMNLFIAARVEIPASVPGALRAAVAADGDWVARAFADFAVAIDAGAAERGESRTTAAAYMRRGDVFVWEVGGAPVSMACAHRMAPDGARVGPVYTPPAMRGRGYASAAVATLTARLLDGDAAWCAIFSDVDNATTNAIYRRIGYNRHSTHREYDFAS